MKIFDIVVLHESMDDVVVSLPTNDIDEFIRLIKKYGMEAEDGTKLKFYSFEFDYSGVFYLTMETA